MKKLTKFLVGALCALAFVTATVAADTGADTPKYTPTVVEPSNAWVISLGGTGSTATVDEHDTAVGVDLSIGRTGHLLLPLEAGVRQGVSYDSTALFSTKLYADWTVLSFSYNRVDVFVGANAGLLYGDVQETWLAAPEAGLRIWVKEDVAILLRAEAPFQLDNGAEFTDSVKYFLGFQVSFK